MPPSLSGTTTDLGILLPPGEDWKDRNEALLTSLRQQVKNPKQTSEDFEAFAAFCPEAVAEYFIKGTPHGKNCARAAQSNRRKKPMANKWALASRLPLWSRSRRVERNLNQSRSLLHGSG